MLPKQSLCLYQTPSGWRRGNLLVRVAWMFFGNPLVSSFIPGTPWRHLLLKLFSARIGVGGRIKPHVRITSPWNLTLGDYCWLGEGVWIDNLAPVVIGDNVCISQGAYLCTGNHDYKSPGFDLLLGSIYIASESWIAAKAVLAPGTEVGVGAVVSLGAVVSGVVEPGVIVRGNPALPYRDR